MVFFDSGSADLSPEAAEILDWAVAAYGNCGSTGIALAGHTDRSGSAEANMDLSERRNVTVRSYLSGRGIPATRIESQAFGESMPRVQTADDVPELQNNRVEITFGPPQS